MSTSGFNCLLLLGWYKEGKQGPYLNSTEQDNTNCIKLSAQNSDTQDFALLKVRAEAQEGFLSFFRLHFLLNKADPLRGQQHCSCRTQMRGKGGSPHQAELLVLRIFRSSALSQQPTQTLHKITADLHAKTLFTQIFILSAVSHKHTTLEKSTKAIQACSSPASFRRSGSQNPDFLHNHQSTNAQEFFICVSFSGDLL